MWYDMYDDFCKMFGCFHHQKWSCSSENPSRTGEFFVFRQDTEIRFPVAGQVRGGFYNMVILSLVKTIGKP
jgi:hypothetical protein